MNQKSRHLAASATLLAVFATTGAAAQSVVVAPAAPHPTQPLIIH